MGQRAWRWATARLTKSVTAKSATDSPVAMIAMATAGGGASPPSRSISMGIVWHSTGVQRYRLSGSSLNDTANATVAATRIAGAQSGRRTRVTVDHGDAPRSADCSSYDVSRNKTRVQTTSATNGRATVTCPMSCVIVFTWTRMTKANR